MTAELPPSPPVLTAGDGLLLRAWTAADADPLHAAWADPAIRRWTSLPAEFSGPDAAEFVARTGRNWQQGVAASFVLEEAGAFAGTANLGLLGAGWAEVGYLVVPASRGRGLARRAVARLLAWGFDDLGLHGVRWTCAAGNWASRRVAWACGFRFEGTGRGLGEQHGRRPDAWTGSLLRAEGREPAADWLDVPVLDGDGVRLRPWRDADAARVVAACSDPRTQRWLPDVPSPYGPAEAAGFFSSTREAAAAGEAVHWCVADPADDRCLASMSAMLAGRGALTAELGWWAHPDARGRGVVTRAARLAAAHAL
ncbi:GNAT family N-acetyltransferase, partial [Kineococcus glutinatus]|uniref:GNAT family N-acetyltransferase n=1 Tax=Kineococcus glutinatus TaxID=1070872 RepID=UPI0031E9CF32